MKITIIKKALFATFILSSFCMISLYAQNLLNLEGWTIGEGSSGIFNVNGTSSENTREWGEGPGGERAILWKATPDSGGEASGGWNSNEFSINHVNMYRFSVWMKMTNSMDGYSYLGCQNVSDLNGTPNYNPYFYVGKLPELNKWYLVVGYIHGSGDASLTNYGGIYDGITGIKVLGCTDFKFSTSNYTTLHRSFLYYDSNLNDRKYFYAPRVDLINGNEPSIESLLGLSGGSSTIAYFPGKVGVQTPNPGNYELAVNGEVRAKEVRVETGWSDFVFEKDYPLLPLTEVEAFIKKNKHLPDVPSEYEVNKNGVKLGSINSKLLQKVEELTLYLIQMDKELKQLRAENLKLKR